MIDVSAKIKAAFQSDSMMKTYYLQFPEVVNTETQEVEKPEKIFTNINIKNDSITLTEPMCSNEQLKFGCNEAATFEVEIEYTDDVLKNRPFNVFLMLGNYSEQEDIFTVGRYIVDSEEIDDERQTKKITAYDSNYYLNSQDVTYWVYNEINLPMTIKQLRDSLFNFVGGGYEQVSKTLINDAVEIETNPFDGQDQVKFQDVISGILEANACFGHINRNGLFDYISLTANDNEENYPSETNYPSSTNFPKSIKGKNYYLDPHLIKSDITWQNYKCKSVDTIQVRNNSGRAVLEYHVPEKSTYTNIYVMQNWIINAVSSAGLQTLIYNFANAIKHITYTPCNANIRMDLSLEVGDALTLTTTKGNKIPTFILSRTMTGAISAFDEIEATGYEEWVNDTPDNDGAVNDLINDLSDLDDRVSALENGAIEGGISILSVKKLPEAPKKNVLYLVQGRVTVI